MTGYEVKIIDSSKELSARERISLGVFRVGGHAWAAHFGRAGVAAGAGVCGGAAWADRQGHAPAGAVCAVLALP